MGKRFDEELLTMSRCKALIMKLPRDARVRVTRWLEAISELEESAANGATPPVPPDPRQAPLFE